MSRASASGSAWHRRSNSAAVMIRLGFFGTGGVFTPRLGSVRTSRTAACPGWDHLAYQHGWPFGVFPGVVGVLLAAEAARGSFPAPGIEVVDRVARLPVTTSSFREKPMPITLSTLRPGFS